MTRLCGFVEAQVTSKSPTTLSSGGQGLIRAIIFLYPRGLAPLACSSAAT
jgi:hypothetical protein